MIITHPQYNQISNALKIAQQILHSKKVLLSTLHQQPAHIFAILSICKMLQKFEYNPLHNLNGAEILQYNTQDCRDGRGGGKKKLELRADSLIF